MKDWKKKFHDDVLLEDKYWDLVGKIPGVFEVSFKANQKDSVFVGIDAKDETEASLKEKYPLLRHPRVKLDIRQPVQVLECFREIRRDDGVHIEGTLGAVCFSPDSSELFGLTAHHVIKGEPHTEIFFLNMFQTFFSTS